MPKIEVAFEEVLPRVALAVSILYRVKIDGSLVPGALKIDFTDPFLTKHHAMPISSPDPVRFSDANQALITEIGRLHVGTLIQNMAPQDITRLCAGLGKTPIGNITHATFSDKSLDDLLDRLRKR